MHAIKGAAAVCLTLGLLALAASAQAQGTTVNDPAGDATAPGLDITGATLSNRDHAFVAALTFVADAEGNVIVAVGTRDGHLLRVISEHPSHGPDNTYLLGRRGQTVPCNDLSSSWERTSASLLLRMPSECILGGDYGAVHSWVLTEDPSSGRDVDFAPENAQGDIRFTEWLPRG